jgi:hypothetical protein
MAYQIKYLDDSWCTTSLDKLCSFYHELATMTDFVKSTSIIKISYIPLFWYKLKAKYNISKTYHIIH